jgi:hypothetical protein
MSLRNLSTVVAVFLIVFAGTASAQDSDTTYWKKKFKGGVTFNQAAFSNNWVNGGVNSYGFNTFLFYKADYARGVHTWDNTIDMSYGILKNEGQSSRKSVDYILLDTKYGRQISPKWNLFTALNFQSQFAPGYKYDVERPNGETYDSLISDFMSPAFLTSSWGAEYKPTDYFKVRLSPFAPRFTFVLNDEIASREVEPGRGPYGLDLGDKVRTEWLAFQLYAQFDKDLAENLNLKWSYLLYINYQNIDPKFWDHRLDVVLNAQVWKFVSVQLGAIMIYDFDQDPGAQFNQYLNFGFVYNFQNYEEEE